MEAVGIIIMVLAGLSGIQKLLWFLVFASSNFGAKLSKKMGTSNRFTNQSIATTNSYSKSFGKAIIWRVVALAIGGVIYGVSFLVK